MNIVELIKYNNKIGIVEFSIKCSRMFYARAMVKLDRYSKLVEMESFACDQDVMTITTSIS